MVCVCVNYKNTWFVVFVLCHQKSHFKQHLHVTESCLQKLHVHIPSPTKAKARKHRNSGYLDTYDLSLPPRFRYGPPPCCSQAIPARSLHL